jgi:hypothetical protein
MVILVDSINCIYGYHGSRFSDAGLAIKTGKYDGGANDDQVLFGYASFKDAIKGRDIERNWVGGYGRFITELKCPYDKMIIFDENLETNPILWNLPPNIKDPDAVSIYCQHNSSKTAHIWGGVWHGMVVLFRKNVLPRIANREMDQFEEKWYPIGTLPKKYPEETFSAIMAKRNVRRLGTQAKPGINPKELSHDDKVKYWKNKLGRELKGYELSGLKYNPDYRPH